MAKSYTTVFIEIWRNFNTVDSIAFSFKQFLKQVAHVTEKDQNVMSLNLISWQEYS